jgi:hypothetical protein
MECKRKFITVISLSVLWMGIPLHTSLAQPIGLKASPSVQKQKADILGTPGGRYLFGQLSDSSKDQFMLDSLTGRLWRISESGEVGPYLNPVPYRGKDGKYSNQPGEPSEAGERNTEKK